MINSFRGDNGYLSNFWDCTVVYNGRTYRNSESAYQAQKFLHEYIQAQFGATSGSEAKALAKTLKHDMRKDWHQVNLGFMCEIVHAKFTQNKSLRELLMTTYPQQLTEGNYWHDSFWGVCDGIGQNWLGRILMAERIYWLDLTCQDRYKDDRLVLSFEAWQRTQISMSTPI
jgi:ribA/ribD-fused uncharacterized protein